MGRGARGALVCLLFAVLFVGNARAACEETGGECVSCETEYLYCNATAFTELGSCGLVVGLELESDSPCFGKIKPGDYVCTASGGSVDTALLSDGEWKAQKIENQNAQEACEKDDDQNPSCCTACLDPQKCFCPKVCAGPGSRNATIKEILPATGFQQCYPVCESCGGYGKSDQWCQANCGTKNPNGFDFACRGFECCDGNSGSILFSWYSFFNLLQ
eukprot:TRINITY_DN10736_c0_g1_i1.p1 TRINITY_DN10736_c0_g1~~TRINITY_DN10736_c0_g1_i1.p1  ORF type:complete len:217 (-),score=31.72 TRINITY_DN10736_c0_g1_i1:16-666(-)